MTTEKTSQVRKDLEKENIMIAEDSASHAKERKDLKLVEKQYLELKEKFLLDEPDVLSDEELDDIYDS